VDDQLLGKRPDEQIALLLRRTVTAVKHRQWSAAEDQLLGSAPDSEIARQLGCNESVVRVRRCKLDIKSHRHKWTPKADRALGQMSDEAAAKQIGCSVNAIKAGDSSCVFRHLNRAGSIGQQRKINYSGRCRIQPSQESWAVQHRAFGRVG